jgi:hypothetical protein
MPYDKKKSWVRNKRREKTAPRATASGRRGYVYVMYLGMANLYKIGRTGNLQERVRALAAGNPRIVPTLAYRVKDMYRCESVLHRRYRQRCLNEREVYGLELEDLANIRAYLSKRGE